MNATGSFSPGFLTELDRVYSSLRPQSLSPTFVSELERIYSSLPAPIKVDFKFLATHFEAWRQWAQEKIRLHLNDLPPDDPLLCPISLFRTMDFGRLETAHTRTLAWLLDRKKEHKFGDTLLAALLRSLTAPRGFDNLIVQHVEPEYKVTNDRLDERGRLDVFAEGQWSIDGNAASQWTLVIEAKIDAWEGAGQLAKYDAWLKQHKRKREILRVFLTPKGRAAEPGSEHWRPLSFLDLVLVFRGVYNELRDKEGFAFLRYYLAGVLQDVCKWPRNIMDDAADPYAVVSYLKTVHDSLHEGSRHDSTR